LRRSRRGATERLRRDVVPGALWRASVVVLDDLSRAPGEALGILLGILGRRSLGEQPLPLETAVATVATAASEGASDPLDPTQLDRFAIQVRMRGHVYGRDWSAARSVLDHVLAERDPRSGPEDPALQDAERRELQERAARFEVPHDVRARLLELVDRLRQASGPAHASLLSDRFARSALRVVRAHALLRGSDRVTPVDLAALRYLLGQRVPEDVRARFDALLHSTLEELEEPQQVAVGASKGEQAGPASAGARNAAVPRVPHPGERRLEDTGESPPAVRAADVAPLLRALEGRIERGLVAPREHPGGAPRGYRPLRTLDEIHDSDPVDVALLIEGRNPAPTRTFRRERREAAGTLAVARDVSASMEGKLSAWAGQVVAGIARIGARRRMRVGYLEFNHEAERFSADGRFFHRRYRELLALAGTTRAEGRTSYEAPLALALGEFARRPGRSRHLVLLTDGMPVLGDPAVRRERLLARRLGVRVHTVFLGLGPYPEILDAIAADTGGLAFVVRPTPAGGLTVQERPSLV